MIIPVVLFIQRSTKSTFQTASQEQQNQTIVRNVAEKLKSPKNLKMRLEGNERLHPPSIQQAVPDPRGPAGSLKPTEDCFLRLLGRYF